MSVIKTPFVMAKVELIVFFDGQGVSLILDWNVSIACHRSERTYSGEDDYEISRVHLCIGLNSGQVFEQHS